MISALTIGVPSFFLAMEPNYERVTGSFIRGVLRRAFPGGLTNIFVVLAAQAYMKVFGLTLEQTGTVCAAILSVVGLLVLYQVCKPFDRFRKIIWFLMAAALVFCFVFLNGFFDLHTGDLRSLLVLGTLVIMSYSVFTAIRRVFDLADALLARLRQWKEKRHADL
jgi:cation-transporting ATPase E